MKIVVVGTGYVGLVTGACFADLGEKVTCVDIDKEKIQTLLQGKIPFFEPGLKKIVQKNIKNGNLTFTTSLQEALRKADVAFIAVGTPPKENGSADLRFVEEVATSIGKHLDHYVVVVNKSTVPIGTMKKVTQRIAKNYTGDFDVVSNPEFLREGSAVKDFKYPDRIVMGTMSEKAKKVMKKLYKHFDCPKLFTNAPTAEMIKYASNAFLATKISFINEIANVCENVDADVTEVSKGMGLDKRIGSSFLQAGIGYGGSCFPKDVRALHYIADHNGYDFKLLSAVVTVNNDQKWHFYDKIKQHLKTLKNKKIAVWGLTFKPDTDDMRESVSIDLVQKLVKEGARVKAYDPIGMEQAKKIFGDSIMYAKDIYECLQDADALVVITEWKEFKHPDFKKVKKSLKKPLIFDGRNIYSPNLMKKEGFTYVSIGRPAVG